MMLIWSWSVERKTKSNPPAYWNYCNFLCFFFVGGGDWLNIRKKKPQTQSRQPSDKLWINKNQILFFYVILIAYEI